MDPHYAENYSLIMGIVDLIPVILFGIAGSILIRAMFNNLKKPFAVLLCSGVTLGLTAGTFKAIWKILLALNVCDFYPLNYMFMPVQALCMVLMGVGLFSVLWDKNNYKATKVNMVAWPIAFIVLAGTPATLYDGNMLFIALLVIGEFLICVSLSYLAIRNKKWVCLALFIVSFICLMIMGAMKPISTKTGMDETTANWVEEGINTIAQTTLFVGCLLMTKSGFFAFRQKYQEIAPQE